MVHDKKSHGRRARGTSAASFFLFFGDSPTPPEYLLWSHPFAILAWVSDQAVANMSAHAAAYELSTQTKDSKVSVDGQDSPHAQTNGTSRHAAATQHQHESLASTTRIRRLFSEAQLFAFALTFMSTWVGMNTFVVPTSWCLRASTDLR
jgi:hypothetical protein